MNSTITYEPNIPLTVGGVLMNKMLVMESLASADLGYSTTLYSTTLRLRRFEENFIIMVSLWCHSLITSGDYAYKILFITPDLELGTKEFTRLQKLVGGN